MGDCILYGDQCLRLQRLADVAMSTDHHIWFSMIYSLAAVTGQQLRHALQDVTAPNPEGCCNKLQLQSGGKFSIARLLLFAQVDILSYT